MTAVTKVSPCGRAVWEQVFLNKGWKVGKTVFLAYSHWLQAKQAGKLDIHKRVNVIYATDVKGMHNSVGEWILYLLHRLSETISSFMTVT